MHFILVLQNQEEQKEIKDCRGQVAVYFLGEEEREAEQARQRERREREREEVVERERERAAAEVERTRDLTGSTLLTELYVHIKKAFKRRTR